MRHGASETKKLCSQEGCTNLAKKGGVCISYRAKPKREICSHEECTDKALKVGVCIRHGAAPYTKKLCSHEGCTNQSRNGGVCTRHGATMKRCSHEGCTNQARNGGVCTSHGATVPSAVVKDARTMPFREEFASDMVQRYIVKSRLMKDVPHFNRDAGCATGMISTKSVYSM